MFIRRLAMPWTVCGVWLLFSSRAPLISPGVTQAESTQPAVVATHTTIPYTARLEKSPGVSAPDGLYDFTFTLYDSASGGQALWSETQSGLPLAAGTVRTELGRNLEIRSLPTTGERRWLEIRIKGPGESEFTALQPRQLLTQLSPGSPSAAGNVPSCPHYHAGENWHSSFDVGLVVSAAHPGFGLIGSSSAIGPFLVYPLTESVGLYGYGDTLGVLGQSVGDAGAGVKGLATGAGADGVYGENSSGDGVYGKSAGTAGGPAGVHGYNSSNGRGVFGESSSGIGVYAKGHGGTHSYAALAAYNDNSVNGMAAYLINASSYATAHLENMLTGEVLYLRSNGGTFLRAIDGTSSDNVRFRLESNGEAFADGSWHADGADFAEMMPAQSGLEPGDVLAIGDDGTLVRATEPYQISVAGVYSSKPGFVGGDAPGHSREKDIPLAITGIVPVKVTAENGPILPGQLLVASSVPGRAMKAGPNPPQGSVIGKALSKLQGQQGIVRMLATLQ